MEVDIDRLRQELNEIDRERQNVNERLREYSVRGRGRGGPGGFSQRPGPGAGPRPHAYGFPPAGEGDSARPGLNRHERIPSFGDRTGHAPPPREGDAPGPYRSASGGELRRDNGWRGDDRRGTLPGPPPARPRLDWQSRYGEGPREPNQARFAGRGEPDGAVPGLPPPPAAAPAAPERKRVLSSAVVVADSAQRADAEEEAPGIAKRPREAGSDDNPAAKKRNRRMFGALLGTLQKFKEEDAAERGSRLAQQRLEALRRADARAAEEVLRAREHERSVLAQQRMAELNRKRELNAAAEVKRGELALAKRYAHQARLAAFLRTAAAPRLFWQPARHCADTILLQEQAQLDLSVWLEGEKAKLEEEKAKVVERTKAIIAQAERARSGPTQGEGRPGGRPAGGANGQAQQEEHAQDEEGGQVEEGGDVDDEGMGEEGAEQPAQGGEGEEGAHEPGTGDGGDESAQQPQQQPQAANDRYIADPEGSPHREAQEAGGADDDMDAYAADGPAETVEDLLK